MTPRSLAPRVLLIDTNLLVLLLVGALAPDHVSRFRRTRTYTAEDFALLARFVTGFGVLVTTPNVMTETSNLLGQLDDPLRRAAMARLGAFAAAAAEHYHATASLAGLPPYLPFGLTDASIAQLAADSVTVLTDDLKLCNHLTSVGLDAVNFNHVRAGSWS